MWHYFCPTLSKGLWFHMAYWHFTWPQGESFESVQYWWFNKQFICDTTNKKDQKCDFETQLKCGKTDRTHQTECGVRTELWKWLERKVKWIWTLSNERWREAAQRLENITDTLRANIYISILSSLIHYLHTPIPVNWVGKSFLIVSTIRFIYNILVSSQQLHNISVYSDNFPRWPVYNY
jgi:hypothetical protein